MTITRNWIEFSFLLAPIWIYDSTVWIGSDLLDAVDVKEHVTKSILLILASQGGIEISVTDATVWRHRQVVIRIWLLGLHHGRRQNGGE